MMLDNDDEEVIYEDLPEMEVGNKNKSVVLGPPQLAKLTREDAIEFVKRRKMYERSCQDLARNQRNLRANGENAHKISIKASQIPRIWKQVANLLDKLTEDEVDEMTDAEFLLFLEDMIKEEQSWTLEDIELLFESQLTMDTRPAMLRDRLWSIHDHMERIIEERGLTESLNNEAGQKLKVTALIECISYKKVRDFVKSHVKKNPELKKSYMDVLKWMRQKSPAIQEVDSEYFTNKKGAPIRTLGQCRAFYKLKDEEKEKKRRGIKRVSYPQSENKQPYKKQKNGKDKPWKHGKSENNKESKKITCLKCQGDHKVFDCTKCGKEEASQLYKKFAEQLREKNRKK